MKKTTLTALACVGAVALAGSLGAAPAQADTLGDQIARYGNSPELTPIKMSPVGGLAADAALLDPSVPIIVLGARLNPDCSAPAVLNSRVATARVLAAKHPLNPVVVTGGATQPGCQTEAEYMRDTLTRSGVKNRVVVDNTAMSTVGNAAGTAHRAGSVAGVGRAGVVVTSQAHMPRALNTYTAANNSALWLAVPAPVN